MLCRAIIYYDYAVPCSYLLLLFSQVWFQAFSKLPLRCPFEAYIAYVTLPYLLLCRVLFVSVGTQAWALPGQYHT